MSHHIPDVTKMIGETPRTNKNRQCFFCSISGLRDPSRDYVEIEFSRQLERELNAANERIKRLEEALESIQEYWNRDNNERAMEDACWHAINTASDALEAKDPKP